MTQYINKDDIVAEIERIKKEECPVDSYEGRCKLLWFEQFLYFINNLETKEVDLEKELKNLIGNVGQCDRKLAKHFYELGLKASSEIKAQKGGEEMTQEEKAKAYDEALERSKTIYQGSYKPDKAAIIAETLQNIFPELGELEDEKIRKDLIKFIQKRNRSGCDYDYDKWIEWLEKQGNQKHKDRYI